MYAKLRDLIGIPKKFSGDEFPRGFCFCEVCRMSCWTCFVGLARLDTVREKLCIDHVLEVIHL